MAHEVITTVHITKKELHRLLDLAKERKVKVDPRKKGDCINYYLDDELFAEEVPGWCNIIIKLGKY